MFVEQVNPGGIEQGLIGVACEGLEKRLATIVSTSGSQRLPKVEIYNGSIWLYNNVFRRKITNSLNFDDVHAAIDGIVEIEFGELCDLLQEFLSSDRGSNQTT